jgi:hypothetical protein
MLYPKQQHHKHIRALLGTTLFFLLACNATFSAVTPTVIPTLVPTNTNLPPAETFTPIPALIVIYTPTAALSISQQVTLTSVPINETNPGSGFPQYTITAQIPQLTGSDDPRVLAFNQRLNDLVTHEVDVWRQSFQQLPLTPLSNGSFLDLTYSASQTGELWSFKFDSSFYADTAAHPGLISTTLNYDLEHGRELTLADLFLPSSNYLDVISKYCISELGKQPFFEAPFSDGAKPTPENYRNWNITPAGLLITFDTYQVGPGAAGPQAITVPYNELTSVIDAQGPLSVMISK